MSSVLILVAVQHLTIQFVVLQIVASHEVDGDDIQSDLKLS